MLKKILFITTLFAYTYTMENGDNHVTTVRSIKNLWKSNAYLIIPPPPVDIRKAGFVQRKIRPIKNALIIPGKASSDGVNLPVKNGDMFKISKPSGVMTNARAHHNMNIEIGYDKVTIS